MLNKEMIAEMLMTAGCDELLSVGTKSSGGGGRI